MTDSFRFHPDSKPLHVFTSILEIFDNVKLVEESEFPFASIKEPYLQYFVNLTLSSSSDILSKLRVIYDNLIIIDTLSNYEKDSG